MPRYFFDTFNGRDLMRDDMGLELDDLERVRIEAIDALPDLARNELPDGDEHIFAVQVRDEQGRVVYSATLDFKGKWSSP